MNKDARIIIVGAGPAGLLTAHYLRENGYNNVTVLEKLGRVGGLCKSITVQGHAFDLGANYITPAYTEIHKIARKLRAKMYSERPMVAMSIPESGDGKVSFQTMFEAMRFDDQTGEKISLLSFLGANLRFVWLRWRLRRYIDGPTFEGIENAAGGELCKPLGEWLELHKLSALRRVLQLPTTLMGYGTLATTPAVYILKFMTLRTFIPMVLKEIPVLGRLFGWPKRFVNGYQRFFQQLSWGLDVRLNIDISHIERDAKGVRVHYRSLEQDLNNVTRPEEPPLDADYLIMACPLTLDVSGRLLTLEQDEQELFSSINLVSYCMSTFNAKFSSGGGLGGDSPLAAVYPVPPLDDRYLPYGVAKQWTDSGLVQVYTSTWQTKEEHPGPGDPASVKEAVTTAARKVIQSMPGCEHVSDGHHSMDTFNRWPYFQHVDSDVMSGGWYTRLEALQGRHRTYYVGGATNFELIEPIAEYAKHQVAKHFPAR